MGDKKIGALLVIILLVVVVLAFAMSLTRVGGKLPPSPSPTGQGDETSIGVSCKPTDSGACRLQHSYISDCKVVMERLCSMIKMGPGTQNCAEQLRFSVSVPKSGAPKGAIRLGNGYYPPGSPPVLLAGDSTALTDPSRLHRGIRVSASRRGGYVTLSIANKTCSPLIVSLLTTNEAVNPKKCNIESVNHPVPLSATQPTGKGYVLLRPSKGSRFSEYVALLVEGANHEYCIPYNTSTGTGEDFEAVFLLNPLQNRLIPDQREEGGSVRAVEQFGLLAEDVDYKTVCISKRPDGLGRVPLTLPFSNKVVQLGFPSPRQLFASLGVVSSEQLLEKLAHILLKADPPASKPTLQMVIARLYWCLHRALVIFLHRTGFGDLTALTNDTPAIGAAIDSATWDAMRLLGIEKTPLLKVQAIDVAEEVDLLLRFSPDTPQVGEFDASKWWETNANNIRE